VLKQQPAKKLAASVSAAASGTVAAHDAGGAARRLSKHFTNRETSHASQIADAAGAGRPIRAAVRAGLAAPTTTLPQEALDVRFYPNLGVMLGTATREGLAALRADDQVESVSGAPPIRLIRPTRRAAAKLTAKLTWGIRAIKADSLWKQGLSGTGVLIGHLDTGVDGDHPCLKGAIAKFAEFDDFGRQVQPTPKPFDSEDHGTHTAATIAGRPVRGRHVGVAPKAMLASAAVIESGDALARVLGGMDWAVGEGVRILSMSLGFPGWWDDFVALTNLLRDRGVLPIFAVGNEGPGTSRSPGNYGEALSVGAHDRRWRVADFSSSQQFTRKADPLVPDLVAPGVGVVSARPGGRWQSMNGSSMATPHVAGLASLLMEAAPARSSNDIESAIFESCRLRPGQPHSRANRGVPDGVKALRLLA
jgi:subtilisin family serine protease